MNRTKYVLGKEAQRDINLYYDIGKELLGEGSYGKVYKCFLKGTQVQRAVKIIVKLKIRNTQRITSEVEIMMKLDHPHIARLNDYFEDNINVYLVIEYCSGGSLSDRLKERRKYSEDNAAIIFKQIIRATLYCHVQGICHRDFKLENFIMIS